MMIEALLLIDINRGITGKIPPTNGAFGYFAKINSLNVLYDQSLSGSDFVQLSIIIGLFFRFALLRLYSVNITKYYGTFSKIFFIPGVWEQAGVWALSQRKARRKSL